MNGFIAAGDVLINPALVSYAIVEVGSDGVELRIGFADSLGTTPDELRLAGLEARSVLRWLRSQSEFLDAGSLIRRAGSSPTVSAGTGPPGRRVSLSRLRSFWCGQTNPAPRPRLHNNR